MKIDKLICSKRKTIALQITDEAKLIVRAPYRVSEGVITKVINKHKKWIENKKKDIEQRLNTYRPKEFVNGEGFLYLGISYKLQIVEKQDKPIIFENVFYLRRDCLPNARDLFIKWYKKEAYNKIRERVEFYAKQRGFKFNTVKISNASKRWGSCSSKGNLNFSWRLIMAPLTVIDYVVIHELAHIEVKNHSKRFWNIVKIMMPDYEKHRAWLKLSGYSLNL
ncbi:MAG TPA: M48 family metallopeptidase [Nitrospirae bacterium]|nr:M48 family metallopeptidase [Nitrospirota bacterium]